MRCAFPAVGGHRLFGDDVATGVERADDIIVVESVGGGDDHRVGLLLAQHLVEIGGEIGPGRPLRPP
jgi:hypothetical protein